MKLKFKVSDSIKLLSKKEEVNKKIISKFLEGQKPVVKQD